MSSHTITPLQSVREVFCETSPEDCHRQVSGSHMSMFCLFNTGLMKALTASNTSSSVSHGRLLSMGQILDARVRIGAWHEASQQGGKRDAHTSEYITCDHDVRFARDGVSHFYNECDM
jgi:hypothetical protein